MKGMFDNVRFTGEISLGAFSIAFTQLILAVALYLRELIAQKREERNHQRAKDLLEQNTRSIPPAVTGTSPQVPPNVDKTDST